jgi:hypothetical protein
MGGEGGGDCFEGAAAGRGKFVVGAEGGEPPFDIVAYEEVPEVAQGEVRFGRDGVGGGRLS